MRPLDTSDEVWRFLNERCRSMTGPERTESLRRLRRSVLRVFKDGVRHRHPDYTNEQIHLVVMRHMLGGSLYAEVFPGRPRVEP